LSWSTLVITGSESYELRFFHRSQAQPKGADGLYGVTGAPYVVWRVENPRPGSNGFWRVTRILAGREVVTEVDESQPGRRIFSEGNGLRITETATIMRGSDREEAITVRDAAGSIASKAVRVFPTVFVGRRNGARDRRPRWRGADHRMGIHSECFSADGRSTGANPLSGWLIRNLHL
jgi:hypothetical protein